MPRPIVLLSLLAAAVAIWVVGIVSPAGAGAAPPTAIVMCPAAGAQIVPCCPLAPQPKAADAQPICCKETSCCTSGAIACCLNATIPCCLNATTPCCLNTTTQCCLNATTPCCAQARCLAGSLTIASSPNPSIAGRRVVISGGFVGSPASGANVALWRRGAGQSGFEQVAQARTDSAGRYTFTLRAGTVMTDQAWYVSSNGLRSATLTQHVRALVGLRASTRSARVGHAVVLRGSVSPSHAGQTVLIEQSGGTAWHVIARARLGRGSSYAVSHRFRQRGVVELRTVLRGDARNDTSVSRAVALTVKP